MKNLYSLGIDTSNYKTSVALVDCDGKILFNAGKFLEVRKGERGLRQSDALFQHVKQLPDLLKELFSDSSLKEKIGCISVSSRPRPIEGSYMPVFLAGLSTAKALSYALNVPLFEFSHQEGHIEAIRFYTYKDDNCPYVCFHFSGGTTEAILRDKNSIYNFNIVGGSRDLSYGQLFDRTGVAMGLDFPCGQQLDKLALSCKTPSNVLTKIRAREGYVNLSGIETQVSRALHSEDNLSLVGELFLKSAASIADITKQIAAKYNISDFIYAGGVSSSKYIRTYLSDKLGCDFNLIFGNPALSSDNAVGTALLGGLKIWL